MTQEEMNKEQEKPRKSRGCGVKLLMLSVVVLVLGALVGYAYLKIEDKTPEQVAAAAQQSASEYVSQLLANSAVNMSASNTSGRAVELYSLYEKDFVVVYEYSTSWMFSTKKIKVIQPYRVRYGISTTKADLQCGWKTYNEIIQVGNLKPCVISCERFGLQQYEEVEGQWNKIQPEERALVQNQLEEQARRDAEADPAALYLTSMRFIEMLNRESVRLNSKIKYELAH